MTITQTLNKTAGRFTTLVVNKGTTNNTYCAKIASATDTSVRFTDVSTGMNRVVPTKNVVFARSGRTQYRKPRAK